MAHIRKVSQLHALDLSQAEKKLIEACYSDRPCQLEDGEMPPPTTDPNCKRKIRAGVLRYLLLGGCDKKPLPACRVEVSGASIEGDVNLSQQQLANSLKLSKCLMRGEFYAIDASIPGLVISGCNIRKLTLDRSVVQSDLRLRGSTISEGVYLSGTQIEGQLDCEGANFSSRDNFQGPGYDGPPYAFDGQDLRVSQGFFWRNVSISEGAVDLSSADVGPLADDFASWPGEGLLQLSGFCYRELANSPQDLRGRMKWLETGSYWKGEFFPQPYTQLAKVLRELGHDPQARAVLAERERRLKIEFRKRLRLDSDPPSRNYLVALCCVFWGAMHYIFADKLLQGLVGYGHHPFRSLIALFLLVLAASVPAHFAYNSGQFAPNSAVIQTSPGWQEFLSEENPAAAWSVQGKPGQDWETFNPIAYGIDLVVPIISFGQTDAWSPSTTRGKWGKTLWWLEWILSAAGWIVTALGAAAITGIIRRD